MMKWPWSRDKQRQFPQQRLQPEPALTPAHIEALLDKAGRDRVFALARANGWNGSNPPLWVWQQLALEVIASQPLAQP